MFTYSYLTVFVILQSHYTTKWLHQNTFLKYAQQISAHQPNEIIAQGPCQCLVFVVNVQRYICWT